MNKNFLLFCIFFNFVQGVPIGCTLYSHSKIVWFFCSLICFLCVSSMGFNVLNRTYPYLYFKNVQCIFCIYERIKQGQHTHLVFNQKWKFHYIFYFLVLLHSFFISMHFSEWKWNTKKRNCIKKENFLYSMLVRNENVENLNIHKIKLKLLYKENLLVLRRLCIAVLNVKLIYQDVCRNLILFL